MPGILPMKVIKVGSNSQARIAQACDRCRSKKIRCDGIRPCCSQCSNVGFECKTSDKLSRRAFPRGYTESLEERVRSLEAEVRDLKDLLDEKDEKIELLSRLHSNPRQVPTPKMLAPPVPKSVEISKEAVPTQLQDDTFRVEATPLLLDADNRDSHFRGVSSGRSFLETFKRKIQESGKSLAGFDIDTLVSTQAQTLPKFQGKTSDESSIPSALPRIFADRCVNVYFQEWAPLFPVLHKPTFLQIYEEYMSDPEELLDHHKLAQLHLVLGIAGLSSNIVDRVQIAQCERRWRSSLQAVLIESNLATLQCLVLALIYCISKADYKYLKYYKETATGLSRHLLLHESQKRFSFGALTIETRKKVFWTLYAVDCFSAAFLGLPKLLNEYDLHAEYPCDIDDEHVTEEGFEPTLPGEVTKISSALSLFRASRILSKVLEKNYPVESSHELSLQSLGALEAELNQWLNSLPQHLKLTFVHDKPSTDITGSRSAILSLAYYYIRILIHRPAVGSSLGTRASPSIISLADSSKHIIQIVQLLEERSMSFSFCLNKHEMLKLCGLSLLYQSLDLKREGKLMQDIQRLVAIVQQYLGKENMPGVASFTHVASLVTSTAASSRASPAPCPHLAAPVSTDLNISLIVGKSPTQSQFGLITSAKTSEDDILAQHEKFRRATLPNLSLEQHEHRSRGRNYIDSTRSLSPTSKLGYQNSGAHIQNRLKGRHPNSEKALQLDYLSLINPKNLSETESFNQIHPYQLQIPQHQQSQSLKQLPKQVPNSHSFVDTTSADHNIIKPAPNGLLEWEMLLGSLDGGQGNMYDAIYGGLNSTLVRADNSSSSYGDCTPNSPKWDLASLGMNDSGACSVLSFSEESSSLPDELSTIEVALKGEYEVTFLDVQGAGTDGEGYLLEGLDSRLGY